MPVLINEGETERVVARQSGSEPPRMGMGRIRGRVGRGWTTVLAALAMTCVAPAQTAQVPFSRIFEGASLPLRTVPLPMFVRREGGPPTPLPFVPSLQAGDQLVIRRPENLTADLTVLAAAFSAGSRFDPRPKHWRAGRGPKKPDDFVLTIPDQPSVVVVMVSLHADGGTGGRMRSALAEQAERFVDNAAVFSINADNRARWNLFFDALQTMPNRTAQTNFNDYAAAVAKDVGIVLPKDVDINDSASLRLGVTQAAEALEKLRSAKPEDLQKTYAGLVNPLIPSEVRDYIDIAYSIYKLAFRPRSQPRLVFAPAVAAMSELGNGEIQLISSRSFPRTGQERTVAFMSIPVGRPVGDRRLRPSVNRVVTANPRVAIRVEEVLPPPPGFAPLVGSPYLWNWGLDIGGYRLPASYEPGAGVVAELPQVLWETFEAEGAQVRVNFGTDEWLVGEPVRVIRGWPVIWTMRAEDRTRMVSGANVTVHLTMPPHESVGPNEIESVAFIASSGQRVAAKAAQFDAPSSTLRVQFGLENVPSGFGSIEVRLRHLREPFLVQGVRCYSAMPGLAVLPTRVGEGRLTLDQDRQNRVVALQLPGEEWLDKPLLDAQDRTTFPLPREIRDGDRNVQVQLADGRLMELGLTVRPALPNFLAVAELPVDEVPVGAGTRIVLPAGYVVGDSLFRVLISGRGVYQPKERTSVQIGIKARGASPESTQPLGTIPRAQTVWDDAGESPRLIVTTSVSGLSSAEGPLAQGQLMMRLADSAEDTSPWMPIDADKVQVLVLRTPAVRTLRRSSEDGNPVTILEFAANSNVLGVAESLEGIPIATQLVAGGVLRTVIPGHPGSVYLRLAGFAGRVELRLPPLAN